jgi:hypothetical protein
MMLADPEALVSELFGVLSLLKHLAIELLVRSQMLVVVPQRENGKAHGYVQTSRQALARDAVCHNVRVEKPAVAFPLFLP